MSKEKLVADAAPGIWFVGACRTWSEERELLAIVPSLLNVYQEALRVVRAGDADQELEFAVYRAMRLLNGKAK